MQNEERNKLEERILAYFEGGLDGQQSKQLLAEVAGDAEKQSLFTSHETLDRLLNVARTPLETPLLTQKSLSEKIPGLLTYLPHLIGAAETVPILTSSSNGFLSLFAKIPLSTALSIGTSVAVITTAGVVIKNKIDDQKATNLSTRTAVVREHNAVQAPSQFAERAKSNDLSIPNAALATSSNSTAANSSAIPASNNAAANSSAIGSSNGAVVSSTVGVSPIKKRTGNGKGVANNLSNNNSHAIGQTKSVGQNTPLSRNEQMPRGNQNVLSTQLEPIAQLSAHNTSLPTLGMARVAVAVNSAEHARNAPARSQKMFANNSAQTAATLLKNSDVTKNSGGSKSVAAPPEEQPVPIFGAVPLRDGAHASLSSNASRSNIRLIEPDRSTNSVLSFRPFALAGANVILGPSSPTVDDANPSASGTGAGAMMMLGVDVGVSDAFSLRLAGGSQNFRQVNGFNSPSHSNGFYHILISSRIVERPAYWSTLGVVYALNPLDRVPVTLNLNGGVAFTPQALSPMAQLGLSSEIPLTSNFVMRPGVVYTAAWVPEAIDNSTYNHNAIIEERKLSASQLFNNSIGVTIGFTLSY